MLVAFPACAATLLRMTCANKCIHAAAHLILQGKSAQPLHAIHNEACFWYSGVRDNRTVQSAPITDVGEALETIPNRLSLWDQISDTVLCCSLCKTVCTLRILNLKI